eukprot:GHVS01002119.1.p1 GENE.GHVS01002119.1~~GHVS01002119.1.p1  ORF type:complete len:111 (+),score=13.65 GHVS01002119.1:186-518(+)
MLFHVVWCFVSCCMVLSVVWSATEEEEGGSRSKTKVIQKQVAAGIVKASLHPTALATNAANAVATMAPVCCEVVHTPSTLPLLVWPNQGARILIMTGNAVLWLTPFNNHE